MFLKSIELYSVKKSNLLEIHKTPNNIIDTVEIIFSVFFILLRLSEFRQRFIP